MYFFFTCDEQEVEQSKVPNVGLKPMPLFLVA